MQLAFDTYPDSQADLVVNMLFVLDMVLCFRTVYYWDERNAYVAVPDMIVRNYLTGWFAVDFLSSVPFDYIVQALVTNQVCRVMGEIFIYIVYLGDFSHLLYDVFVSSSENIDL